MVTADELRELYVENDDEKKLEYLLRQVAPHNHHLIYILSYFLRTNPKFLTNFKEKLICAGFKVNVLREYDEGISGKGPTKLDITW